jgi:DNA-binding transcriptional MerR regulator
LTKVYYSISEVSKITLLPVSTLRYWEDNLTQLQPYKNEKGKRFYTESDIELVKRIKFIRDNMKITRIEAIQKELNHDLKSTDARQRATELLKRVRQQLVDIRSKI